MTRRRAPLSIQLRSQPGIPLDVRLEVRRLVAWLRRTQPITDNLILAVANAPSIKAGTGYGFGCFGRPNAPPTGHAAFLWVHVAAGVVDVVLEEPNTSREDAIGVLLETILHEFAHYDEWRTGQPADEDFATLRATQLLAAYRAAASNRQEVPA